MRSITEEHIRAFGNRLLSEEKARATREKYLHDTAAFAAWLRGREVDKEQVVAYKTFLVSRYAPASVNTILSSLHSFFDFCGWHDLRVRTLKIQRRIFASDERELNKREYETLLSAAKRRSERLWLLLQTVCSTGIRVSELRDITREAAALGYAEISNKGKRRRVFLPGPLCARICRYADARNIKSGPVFRTKNGAPLQRSNIWREMKAIARAAGIPASKVFPHNLRHLFARTYYTQYKDIVRLADLLGHASVNTTRIYTMESGEVHRRQIQTLGLLRC